MIRGGGCYPNMTCRENGDTLTVITEKSCYAEDGKKVKNTLVHTLDTRWKTRIQKNSTRFSR